MKRSHSAWLAALALVALGFAIGIPWWFICLAVEGKPLANGPWLLVVICFASALVMILRAMRYEREELAQARHAEGAESV